MKSISCYSPSNIALVKYWGKLPDQIPMNPSISFTLTHSYTETKINYKIGNSADIVSLNFLFEGKPNKPFHDRLEKFTNSILHYIPTLKGIHLDVESRNSFPHSSGIASSASAMGAFALCLVSIEKELSGQLKGFTDIKNKASFIARLGSGSASRSIYGGVNLWGKLQELEQSSNEYAIELNNEIHQVFKTYRDAILIVSDKSKKVSSSIGHNLMKGHAYADVKFEQGRINALKLIKILKSGDLENFAELIESEALALHAMMMTSNPSYILMEPNTLKIIEKVRNFRIQSSIPVCFTLDAGANVHLLYPDSDYEKVKVFINDELSIFCNNKLWIDDKVGNGAQRINP